MDKKREKTEGRKWTYRCVKLVKSWKMVALRLLKLLSDKSLYKATPRKAGFFQEAGIERTQAR